MKIVLTSALMRYSIERGGLWQAVVLQNSNSAKTKEFTPKNSAA